MGQVEHSKLSPNLFPKILQPAAIATFHSILTTKSLRKSLAQVLAFETADHVVQSSTVQITGIFRFNNNRTLQGGLK